MKPTLVDVHPHNSTTVVFVATAATAATATAAIVERRSSHNPYQSQSITHHTNTSRPSSP
jgi:hypothetical protein